VHGLSRALRGGALALFAAPCAAHQAGTDARTTEPWVIACLALSLALYVLGLLRLRTRTVHAQQTWRWRGIAFGAGWLGLVLALVSPLDPLGTRSFAAHMLQHELLMAVAAPLLVAARPLGVWAWALSPPARRAIGAALHRPGWQHVWHWLCVPATAWALHALALWGWHVPALFDAAVRHPGVHTLQHSSFLASALLYWWTVLRAQTRGAQGVAVASLFATMLHSGALGALLALSPQAWYGAYAGGTATLGLTLLEDQQLGGLLMWVPAGLIYLAAGLALAARWGDLADDAPRAACRAPALPDKAGH
jgi:cytochrome c oxidase assembly factor CtaG